jgi:hypothetical protein
MEQSTEIKDLLCALCCVQGEMSTMPKDKKGYSYMYTDFDTIVTTIKPLLKKNNIGFMQSLTMVGELPAITTRVFTQSGQYIQDTVTLPKVEMKGTTAAQNMGASITYMKRYALSAMFGITADEDVDGSAADDKSKQESDKKPATQKPTGNPVHTLFTKILSAQYEDGKLIYPIAEKTAWLNTWETYVKQYGEQAGGTRALSELKKNFKDDKTGSDYPDA